MEQTKNNIDPNNPVKEYTGVWIPREVMECEELSATEKIAYGEIACFNECYASNAWIAKRIGKSESTARNSISKLKSLGFVEDCGFNGRFRLIRVLRNSQGRVLKNSQAGCEKINTRDKSIDNKEVTKVTSVAQQPKVASQAPRKKSEFNLTIEKICNILSIDVNKINWSAVGKWYKEGKQNNCTDDDFLLAAQAMAKANKERGVFVSLNKVLTNTSYWLSVAEPVKPKGVWNG